MKTRSELREKIMIILYQIDINRKQNIDYSVEEIIRENLDIDKEKNYLEKLIRYKKFFQYDYFVQ